MTRATRRMREFAERLIVCETTGQPAEAKPFAAFNVCAQLRPHLTTLMGSAGFRALLSRALALASAEVPWLRALHVSADGSFNGLAELEARIASEKFAEDSIILPAQLLGLLAAFIGEDLTLRLVREVWPEASLNNDVNLENGDKNEKTK